MKRSYILLFIFILGIRSYTQTPEKHELSFNQKPLNQTLEKIENKFSIKYNYLDSIVENKKFNLKKRKYSLQQIHNEIAFQCDVYFEKIDHRFYSIKANPQEACLEKVECLAEVVVKGYLSKGINKIVDKTTVLTEKMELLPGIPDADVLFTLQQLPGVLSPNETASGLHIRGGNIDQNLLLWDGIRIQHPGHLFGMISGFNPSVTHQVNLYFKGTPPRFGERISSVIEMKTSNEIPSNAAVKMGVNGLNFDFLLRTPIIQNKLGIEIGGRKSYTECWQTPTFTQLAKKVFQNTSLSEFDNENRFQFNDFSLKINYKPRLQTEIFASTILINNDLDYTAPYLLSHSKNDKMQINNGGSSLQWNEKWNEKWHQNLLIFYSIYDFNYQNKKILDTDFSALKKLNRSINSGIEFNFKHFYNNKNTFEMGYHLLGNDASHAFVSANKDFELVLDNKYLFNLTHVLYFLEKWYHNQWIIYGGVRYQYYQDLAQHRLEPRLLVQNRISAAWSLQFTYEQKSQLMSQIQESIASDLSLENYVWVLANAADIPLVKSHQISIGCTHNKNNWSIDFDLYYKPINGISSLHFGFYNPFDTKMHQGSGFSNGIDLLIQKETSTWKSTLTYSFLNAKNKFNGINNNLYFPINSEIKHSFNINVLKKWNRFSFAMGWNWHTGKPYSVLDNENKITQYNSARLPNYHRLDISGIYALKKIKNININLGFSVYNIYNKNNALSKELQPNFTSLSEGFQVSAKQENYSGLGITPNLFFKLTF